MGVMCSLHRRLAIRVTPYPYQNTVCLARVSGANPPKWWKNNETIIPNWAGVKMALLVQLSSAVP